MADLSIVSARALFSRAKRVSHRIASRLFSDIVSRSLEELRPKVATIMTDGTWHPSDEFLQRLRRHYALSLDKLELDTSSAWSPITGLTSKSADVQSALIDGSDQRLRDLLENPAKTNLYYGVDNLAADLIPKIMRSKEYGDFLVDQFNLLAAAIGTKRASNPEWKKERSVAIEKIVNRLPSEVDFPNPFEGEIGIPTSRGVATQRAIHAIYQAHRMRQEAERFGGSKLLEIGAGMGRTAYYAHRFGLTDYTIVDLPHMLIGQACFLAAILGEGRVWLLGEPKVDGAIRLLPPQSLQPTDCFDVVLNADSMTEMSRQSAERYVSFITERCGVFISINHEVNRFTVRELLGPMPHMRHPYPLRPGYLEEIWTAPSRGITASPNR